MDAQELANQVLSDKSGNLEDALLACIEEGSDVGLDLVIQLADFDYGGTPYKWFDKFSASIAAAYWESRGISRLSELALTTNRYSTITVVARVLAHAASSTLDTLFDGETFHQKRLKDKLDIASERYKSKEFGQAAKKELLNLVINFEPGNPVPFELISTLYFLSFRCASEDRNQKAFDNLFLAFTSRWFGLNKIGIEKYNQLIQNRKTSEEDVHVYLAENPYILDPFYSRIWSKVKLGETLVADFLIRLIDDTYTVVEIEKPGDPILNQKGDLSAQATHAIRQSIEYRDWLTSNQLYARQRFENMIRPNCLVVIGMESNLNDVQRLRLWQENESRQGMVKIVGFDWLHVRSNSIFKNIIDNTLNRYEHIKDD